MVSWLVSPAFGVGKREVGVKAGNDQRRPCYAFPVLEDAEVEFGLFTSFLVYLPVQQQLLLLLALVPAELPAWPVWKQICQLCYLDLDGVFYRLKMDYKNGLQWTPSSLDSDTISSGSLYLNNSPFSGSSMRHLWSESVCRDPGQAKSP